MKNLSEMYNEDNYTSLSKHLNESTQIDEGLKDFIDKIVDKVKSVADRVVDYAKSKVAQFGNLFMAVGSDGILSASTPMTAGSVYKDKLIDTSSAFVSLDNEASKIVGLKTKKEDALKLPAYSVRGINYINHVIKIINNKEYFYKDENTSTTILICSKEESLNPLRSMRLS